MPAVTADTLKLPRLPVLDPTSTRQREVRSVTTAPAGLEGEGFPVRRAFADVSFADVDPFIHMDHLGEIEWAAGEPKGTPWHPHRGFETVTYIIDGALEHTDSHVGGGLISDGDTQWMTAGGGILHIEQPTEQLVMSGGTFHGIQLWVNLPSTQKLVTPRYQDIRGQQVGLVSSVDGGALLRVIAGDLAGHAGPGSTYTPIALAHATISPGAQVEVAWRPEFNALAYVLAGEGTVGTAGRPIHKGQLAVFGPGDAVTIGAGQRQSAAEPNLEVMLLGGLPIREPVFHYGPFVMNTRDEVIQALADFQAGRFGVIPGERVPHTE